MKIWNAIIIVIGFGFLVIGFDNERGILIGGSILIAGGTIGMSISCLLGAKSKLEGKNHFK
jgi:hypothetical protein